MSTEAEGRIISGLFKSLKKVFKRVGRVVKKIMKPALIVGAIALTAGAAAGAIPLLGAGGAATAGGAAGGGGILSSLGSFFGVGGGAAAGGGVALAKGVAGGAGGGGFLGRIASFFGSEVGGNILKGVGGAIGRAQEAKALERSTVAAEQRQEGRYSGIGEATEWGNEPRLRTSGLGGALQAPAMQQPDALTGRPAAPFTRPARPGLSAQTQTSATPRFRFNRDTMRIEYA